MAFSFILVLEFSKKKSDRSHALLLYSCINNSVDPIIQNKNKVYLNSFSPINMLTIPFLNKTSINNYCRKYDASIYPANLKSWKSYHTYLFCFLPPLVRFHRILLSVWFTLHFPVFFFFFFPLPPVEVLQLMLLFVLSPRYFFHSQRGRGALGQH